MSRLRGITYVVIEVVHEMGQVICALHLRHHQASGIRLNGDMESYGTIRRHEAMGIGKVVAERMWPCKRDLFLGGYMRDEGEGRVDNSHGFIFNSNNSLQWYI